jgi:hypothetical protein
MAPAIDNGGATTGTSASAGSKASTTKLTLATEQKLAAGAPGAL